MTLPPLRVTPSHQAKSPEDPSESSPSHRGAHPEDPFPPRSHPRVLGAHAPRTPPLNHPRILEAHALKTLSLLIIPESSRRTPRGPLPPLESSPSSRGARPEDLSLPSP
uniref:Uncharacterized protein n=1 Tax=Solanum lycopersicum TaxID=4081 RepID=A0A3Q7FMI7_SOLLC